MRIQSDSSRKQRVREGFKKKTHGGSMRYGTQKGTCVVFTLCDAWSIHDDQQLHAFSLFLHPAHPDFPSAPVPCLIHSPLAWRNCYARHSAGESVFILFSLFVLSHFATYINTIIPYKQRLRLCCHRDVSLAHGRVSKLYGFVFVARACDVGGCSRNRFKQCCYSLHACHRVHILYIVFCVRCERQ